MFRFASKKVNIKFCSELHCMIKTEPGLTSVIGKRCSHNQSSQQHSSPEKSNDDDNEKDGFLLRTLASIFSMKVDTLALLHQLPYIDFNTVKEWRKNKLIKQEIEDQRFIPERFQILGSDLAAAHFIIYRGGSVGFKDQENWIRKDKNGNYSLPSKFVPNLYLEEIDASGTGLLYEGLSNLEYLYYLKSLNLSNCLKIDDWCLDRLTIFRTTLEHLNISNCPNITERGLSSLYRLRNLKTLNLSNLQNVNHLELVCLLLEDVLPNCKIIGVDYMNKMDIDLEKLHT